MNHLYSRSSHHFILYFWNFLPPRYIYEILLWYLFDVSIDSADFYIFFFQTYVFIFEFHSFGENGRAFSAISV